VVGAGRKPTAETTGLIGHDYTGCLADRIGRGGFTHKQIGAACDKTSGAMKRLRRDLDSGRRGFDSVLDDEAMIASAVGEGRRLARQADTLVVDGIGGSALGPLALYTALRPKRRLVLLDSVDSEGVAVRTGHHCAMPVMEYFNVPATARASFGCYSRDSDIEALVGALHKAREVLS